MSSPAWIIADAIHRKCSHEFESHVRVGGVVHRQTRGDLHHVLTEQRHPGGAVGLFEVATGRQRRTAVEDADVVQAQEAALEDVPARAVLAVDPPGEVEQELVPRLDWWGGSIQVVTKVARLRRALPSIISSSWMIW